MIVSVGFISGLTLGLEFFWDLSVCSIHLGIFRINICWNIEGIEYDE